MTAMGVVPLAEYMLELSSLSISILNLIMNAMEAAGQGGVVECEYDFLPDPSIPVSSDSGANSTGSHHWRIRDNGPGPSSDIADQILEPFVTSKREGVGLGLPTTCRIAEQFGGSLTWSRDGSWTVFNLILREPFPS
jgi:two-component system nitrogen regulation sensor histidine kinase GlnL